MIVDAAERTIESGQFRLTDNRHYVEVSG